MNSFEKIENTIIYLVGFPGTGKYTVAREIAGMADFRIVDNHLINNPVFAVTRVDGKTSLPSIVWKHTRTIRDIVVECMATISPAHFNFVLTNALYERDPVDREIFNDIVLLAEKRSARFLPVSLKVTDIEEHKRRIAMPDREKMMKQTDAAAPHKYAAEAMLEIDHPNHLAIDTTHMSAEDTAKKILLHALSL